MGTFTDQVQRLASEQLTARQRAEINQKQKQRKEDLKKVLYNTLEAEFINASNCIEEYKILCNYDIKADILRSITKDDHELYYLSINYKTILSKVYNEFKENINNKEIEFDLYQLIYNIFTENKNNPEECYASFCKLEIRRDIIQNLAQNNKQTYLYLEKCYNRTLNSIYKTFKNAQITKSIPTKKDIPKQEKTSKTFTILGIILYILSCIGSVLLFIFGLPFVIIFGFLKGKHGL